jgi:hypothetical protein
MKEVLLLQKFGWSAVQARALARLMDGDPSWKPEWRNRLADWCSANEKSGMEGQAAFLSYTLRNTHDSIGTKLMATETEEQAETALKDLWGVLNEAPL